MNVEKSLKMATEIESALSSLTIKHCDSQKRTSVVVNFIETKNQYLDEDFERKKEGHRIRKVSLDFTFWDFRTFKFVPVKANVGLTTESNITETDLRKKCLVCRYWQNNADAIRPVVLSLAGKHQPRIQQAKCSLHLIMVSQINHLQLELVLHVKLTRIET